MTKNLIANATELGAWVDERHLTIETVERYRCELEAANSRSLVIDNFLRADKFTSMAGAYANDLDFPSVYKLSDGLNKVSQEEWEAARERHFYSHGLSKFALPGHEMSPDYLRVMKYRGFLVSQVCRDYFSIFAADRIESCTILSQRLSHDEGHLINWHNDNYPGRVLCLILYMHREWPLNAGGRFEWREPDGREWSVEPLPNRLVMFRPVATHQHRVEPLKVVSTGLDRYAFTVWYRNDLPPKDPR